MDEATRHSKDDNQRGRKQRGDPYTNVVILVACLLLLVAVGFIIAAMADTPPEPDGTSMMIGTLDANDYTEETSDFYESEAIRVVIEPIIGTDGQIVRYGVYVEVQDGPMHKAAGPFWQ